jgi:hypothetical protein
MVRLLFMVLCFEMKDLGRLRCWSDKETYSGVCGGVVAKREKPGQI